MTWLPLVGCLLSCLAFLFVLVAVFVFIRQRNKFNQRTATMGTVTSLERKISTDIDDNTSSVMYYPSFEFITAAGEKIQIQSSFGSNPAGYSVGQQVKISYDPQNPGKAEIDSTTSRYLLTIVLAIFGLVLFCIGLSFLAVWLISMPGLQ